MRIVFINAFWKFGSTGRNTVVKYELLKNEGHDVRVFYGERKDLKAPDDVIYIGNRFENFIHHLMAYFLGLAGRGSLFTTLSLIRQIRKFKPDLIWLYNIHGYYLNENILFHYLRKSRIWVMYDMADEYAFLGKCCSAYECEKFKDKKGCHNCEHLQDYPRSRFFDNSHLKFRQKEKLYHGLDRITFRSAKYVIDKAASSWLLRGREFFEIDTGIDNINVFYPRNTEALREKYKISNNTKVVLACAPINDVLKGIIYYLKSAELCLGEDVIFFDISYGGDEKLCPKNFIPIPYTTDRNLLAEFYSLADVYVCSSISDAQPNACLEALSCGTPIIGFNVSGVPYVAPSGLGTFIEQVNEKSLAAAIREAPKKTKYLSEKCRKYALERYSIATWNKQTVSYLEDMCRRAERDKYSYIY